MKIIEHGLRMVAPENGEFSLRHLGEYTAYTLPNINHQQMRTLVSEMSTQRVIYDLGYPKERFFPYEKHSKALIFTGDAYACVAGVTAFNSGIHVFHYIPGTIMHRPFNLPKKALPISECLVGGGLRHVEIYGDLYSRSLKDSALEYIPHQRSGMYDEDYNYAVLVDMPSRSIVCGYYYRPRSPYSGDGWIID